MTITEQDIPFTKWEKLINSYHASRWRLIIAIPIGLITFCLMVVLLPVLIIGWLFYEEVLAKAYYKLTGREKKDATPNYENLFSKLPTNAEFKSLYFIEGGIDNIIAEHKMDESDSDSLEELGKIIVEPPIPELNDKYFDPRYFTFFKDNLFVMEVKLPNFETSIACINIQNKNYHTIKDFDSHATMSFKKAEDELQINCRTSNAKTLVTVK